MATANHTASTETSDVRVCRTCNVEQPVSNFYFTRQYPWKDCKACESIKSAAKRNADHANFRAKARARDANLRQNRVELTQEELKKWVSYDPDTGLFSRLIFRGNCRPGDKVGRPNHDGYLTLTIANKKYLAHRLAWLYVYGKWPDEETDHINRIRDDNRICNLRDVTRTGNVQNSCPSSANSQSGYMGVYPQGDKWRAKISVDGQVIALGKFDSPEEAHQVYLNAKKQYHPTFTHQDSADNTLLSE